MATDTKKTDTAYSAKSETNTAVSRADELEYLVSIITELQKIALRLDEKTLAYLLELSMVEARLQNDAELYQLRIIEASENNR